MLSILLLPLLLPTALADGASIVASLTTITNTTNTLNASVTEWPGTLLGTLPIITQATQLLGDINDGTETAEASEPLSSDEALDVAAATQTLAGSVNTTLDNIIATKPDFDSLLLGPIILLNLKLELKATEDFSDAVIEKVPEELQELADQLVTGITDSFDKAIDVYSVV